MTNDEARTKSAAKVKQVMELMKVLHLRVEAKERISPEGFVEKIVFWVDDENYQLDQAPAAPSAPEPAAPVFVPASEEKPIEDAETDVTP